MSKKKKKKKQKNPMPQPVQPKSANPEKTIQEIEETHSALSVETTEPLPEVDESEVSREGLIRAWKQCKAIEQNLEEEKKKVEVKKNYLEDLLRENSQEQEALKKEREEWQREGEEEKKTLSEQRKKIYAKEKELIEQERKLLEREANAEAGFSRQNKDALGQLEKELEILRAERKNHNQKMIQAQGEIDERREALEEEYQKKREGLFQEIQKEVQEQRHQLGEEKASLEKKKMEFQAQREILEAKKAYIEEKIEMRISAEKENMNLQIKSLQDQLEIVRESRDDLEDKVKKLEEREREFGRKSPKEVLGEMERLKRENEGLQEKCASSMTTDNLARLEELEAQEGKWYEERRDLQRQINQLKGQLGQQNIAVNQREMLRDEKETLESRCNLLKQMLSDLQREIEQYTEENKSLLPFPNCSKMDEDDDLQNSSLPRGQVKKLKSKDGPKFVEDLQKRVAQVFDVPLYFTTEDLRAFLGGMAMSRLMLLQGISGTGKTSLVQALAGAIGAGCSTIPVQMGWRDRQDLLGYYNTFEKKFYESEFTQALYKASCPQYKDRPYFILLDEINLSHPEHYFADFLSLLEGGNKNPVVNLTSAPVSNPPRLLQDGKSLPLPPNVWFFGTANHDETTVQFADKTYDRSHIMELPRQHTPFKLGKSSRPQYLQLDSLQTVFDELEKQYAKDVENALDFLNYISSDLDSAFGIGWGNRLEKQMKRFIPVVMGFGGTLEEGFDYLLASKIFRKIKNRYDLKVEIFKDFTANFQKKWRGEMNTEEPCHSLQILNGEIKRLNLTS